MSPDPAGGEIYVSIKVTNRSISSTRRAFLTCSNRMFHARKVRRVLTSMNLENWTIGPFERGCYLGGEEPSFAVKLFGQPSAKLFEVGSALANEFHQDATIVLDISEGISGLAYGRLGPP